MLQRDIDKVLEIIIQEIKRACKRSEGVEFRNWFSIRTKIQKAGTRRNPRTGEPVQISSKKVIRFRMAKELFNKLNEK